MLKYILILKSYMWNTILVRNRKLYVRFSIFFKIRLTILFYLNLGI